MRLLRFYRILTFLQGNGFSGSPSHVTLNVSQQE